MKERTCSICSKSDEGGGGLYTDGCHSTDAVIAGIKVGPILFYCDEHKDAAPNFDSQVEAAFADQGLCGFRNPWAGRCDYKKPCTQHQNLKCWKCKKPATRSCPATGRTACAECPDKSRAY